MTYLPQIRRMIPSAQVSDYTTGNITKPSGKNYSNGAIGIALGKGFNESSIPNSKVQIATTGNATNFGNTAATYTLSAAAGSNTRAITSLSLNASAGGVNGIEYFDYSSNGNGTSFGNLTVARGQGTAVSSQTRVIFGMGFSNPTIYNTMDYVTISTTGSATSFGSLTNSKRLGNSTCSPTRGVFIGGYDSNSVTSTDYITIASVGNGSSFGGLMFGKRESANGIVSNGVRGISAGGVLPGGTIISNINYHTIANLSYETGFGFLQVATTAAGGTSSDTRAVFFAGDGGSGQFNTISYLEISTGGTAQSFGTIGTAISGTGAVGNCHGGIILDENSFTSVKPDTEQGLAVFSNGENGSNLSTQDFLEIASRGASVSFGSSTDARFACESTASSTRLITFGGNGASRKTTIDYNTFATRSNATSFGALSVGADSGEAMSNGVLGVVGIGSTNAGLSNRLEYVTIATTGNTTLWGSKTIANAGGVGLNSNTRGVYAGGSVGNAIEYITFATAGNGVDFGDQVTSRYYAGGASSKTRGIVGGGTGNTALIDYITIATLGNAATFGNLTQGREGLTGAGSTITGIFTGGYTSSFQTTTDFVMIASLGNATTTGALTQARKTLAGASNSHGGL